MAATPTTSPRQTVTVRAQPMTPEAFAPYGRVLPRERTALEQQEGRFMAHLMTVRRVPEKLDRINRHLDHSQMFVPLAGERLVVVVAPPDVPMQGFDATKIAAFITDGSQPFVFHTGTWHIEPRSLNQDTCEVVNVQTDVFRDHTELVHLDDLGVEVRLEVPGR